LGFKEKPTYYESTNHLDAKNITEAQQAINETFEHLKTDSSLNFMAVYVDLPDPIGHIYGVNSTEVIKHLIF